MVYERSSLALATIRKHGTGLGGWPAPIAWSITYTHPAARGTGLTADIAQMQTAISVETPVPIRAAYEGSEVGLGRVRKAGACLGGAGEAAKLRQNVHGLPRSLGAGQAVGY